MDVTVYTTKSCPYCDMTKRFLKQRGIPFRERDVSRDPAAIQEMIRLSGQRGVPVTVVNGEVIRGFNRGKFEQVLARASRPRPRFGAKVAGAEAVGRKQGRSLPPGAYIGAVRPNTPAARAGLRDGDIVISLDGAPVRGLGDLQQLLSRLPLGQPLEVVWLRNDREMTGQLVL